jgi:hypothetical protein
MRAMAELLSAQLQLKQAFMSIRGYETASMNLARKTGGIGDDFVYKWQTREGWEVVITHDWRAVLTIIPKRHLD